MNLAVNHAAMLWLLPLALLPLFTRLWHVSGYPSLEAVPRDGLSLAVDLLIRLMGALAIASIILGIGGLHRVRQVIEREGTGARIVLLIDRSSSMNDSFARTAPGAGEESKSTVAKRLIADFIERRPRDRLGVVVFSTSAIPVLPLTAHHQAIKAAVAAIDSPGLTMTHVGLGLAMAISMLGQEAGQDGGAVVLVSDGASVIDRQTQQTLRAMAARDAFNLYWLFLRSEGSRGIFEAQSTTEADTPFTNPERHLHAFLSSLGVPYRAFEATSARAVEQAVAEIDRWETRPLRYFERIARRDLTTQAYATALFCVLVLLAAKLAQRELRDVRLSEPGTKHHSASHTTEAPAFAPARRRLP
jgi:mxaC protein